MSAERQAVTVRDLVGEAKKRIVFLIVSVVGLSYLMSLTSSSVLFNFPAAAFLIIILRYLSLDFDMRRKAATYKNKPTPANTSFQTKSFEVPHDTKGRSDWKMKVNSPVVEDAIDQFTRHLVSEWVTDLWYSRITPDRQAPDELVHVINSVLAEVSCRARNINLIDLLTRDIINLICSHLELFRASQTKIERQKLTVLTSELRDIKLKSVLAAENKLHPALFSAEAEHKVLQHLVDGLITFTFRPKDLQCSLFRYIVRELLACAVIRPVLNLVSPRFINERIESAVISSRKSDKGGSTEEEASQSKPNGSSKISSDSFTPSLDPSVKGVELVQFKKDESRNAAKKPPTDNGNLLSKDPLLATDARSTCSWGSFPSGSQVTDGKKIPQHPSGGEWGEMLALISRRKTEALAPEHFENMWTKGRNYKRKEGVPGSSSIISQSSLPRISETPRHRGKNGAGNGGSSATRAFISGCSEQPVNSFLTESNHPAVMSYEEDDGLNHMDSDKVESGTTSSKETEDEESSTVTGLHSPGIKVWDGKSNRNHFVSHIRHPLEVSEGHKTKKMGKGRAHSKKLPRTQSGRKRSRLSDQKLQIWQEIERTSFLSGDGQDILKSSKGNVKSEDLSDDSETEMLGRIHSGSTASSSMSSISLAESHILAANTPKSLLLTDSYLKLRCEVMGANIVKSGSKIFAVYSISVMDVNGNCWSIKRRFRHFEELHRRLKEFPEYNLHLPPKHFLSTGLDVPVIRERCTLLDRYLKNLLQLPTISGSIEVWDFLSVDSQTYVFSNSLSIIETLSVDLGDTSCEKSREVENSNGPVAESFSSWRGHENSRYMDYAPQTKFDFMADGPRLNLNNIAVYPPRKPAKEFGKLFEDSGSDSDSMVHKHISSTQNSGKINVEEGDGLHEASESLLDTPTDPIFPTEWVPPSLSVPILDLVDVIFQLQDGGWIRRKSFWVAKQVLQLGMGDAFDDWLIEKIQLLHRGSVIASGIRRVEQILWPDGIFITKHPKRQRPASSVSPSHNSSHDKLPTLISSPKRQDINEEEEMQQKEAERRAKFVYELMIDNVPAAIVGLVGRKEYEQCVKDLYYFLQSSVGLKQLAFELLELLLLSAFPEMDYIFKELHEEKARFGECKVS